MAETSQDAIMPLAKLKQTLSLAEREPLGCAFGLTKDKKEVLLLIDKKAKPRKVADQLRSDGKEVLLPATLRFGEVTIDPAEAGTVRFRVNKSEAGGTITLMVRLVKKAGYQAIIINPDLGEEAGEGEGEAQAQSAQAATGAVPEAPPPPPPAEGKMRLTALVQRIGPVTASDPGRKAELLGLAKEAQSLLASGQPADDKIAQLEAALGKSNGAGLAEAPKASDGAAVALGKSGLLWRSCRKQLDGKLAQLKAAVLDAYADEPEVQAEIRKHLGELDHALDGLDSRLEDAIDAAISATDPAKRQQLVEQSRSVIQEYSKYVTSSPMMPALDENPFGVQLGLAETLSKVLSAMDGLSKNLH